MRPVPVLIAALVVFWSLPALTLVVFLGVEDRPATELTDVATAVSWGLSLAIISSALVVPKVLRAFQRTNQLLVALVLTYVATVPVVYVSFQSADWSPTGFIGVLGMVVVLALVAAYRDCFRTDPPEGLDARYTRILVAVGSVRLAFSALRVAAVSGDLYGVNAYVVFMDITIALGVLSVAWLRSTRSTYARCASGTVGWVLLPIPFLPTLSSLYWIFRVRHRERVSMHEPEPSSVDPQEGEV